MDLQPEQGGTLTTSGDNAPCQGTSPESCQLPQDMGEADRGAADGVGDVPAAGPESREASEQGHAPPAGVEEEQVLGPSTTTAPDEHQESEESQGQDTQEELPALRESSESPGETSQPTVEPPSARSPAREREPETDFYCVKWITWKGERTPIITQSENGPCPLLAIMNILFLQWKVKLPPQKEVVTSDELMAHLGDCILSIKPQEKSEGLQLNFQQNVNDAMMVLPKLSTGLDVNVRFRGVSDFEYTPECIVFDLLNVPLYHGWLVDPQSPEVVRAVGKLSYNQLVEKIITCKHSSDSNLVTEGLIAEQFLESTASQLTYHGLCELTAAVKEEELSVFFRNNHFSTMIKHKGHLYLLVTDQGFLQEERVVWESLHNVDGDSCFCDTEFHLSHALGKEGAAAAVLEQSQVDQDYMIALSLQQQQGQGPSMLSDLELARQLQQEEYQQQQPAPAPVQGRAQPGGRPTPERRQRQRPDSDCALL
ncbi:MINY1 hydrolase, partial [Alectura lathami]|nr:MINY1 hydrolase [Alectura lathami]